MNRQTKEKNDQRRIVHVFGDIKEEVKESIRDQLIELDTKSHREIKLLIDSRGGDVPSGLCIYDFLQMLESPVTGIVNGKCASIAIVVLQGCKERVATKHSEFYCHLVRGMVPYIPNELSEKASETWSKRIKKAQKDIENILVRKTGLTIDKIKEIMERGDKYDHYFSASEARRLGFVDKVVSASYKLL